MIECPCPFNCGYSDFSEHSIETHIESRHSENMYLTAEVSRRTDTRLNLEEGHSEDASSDFGIGRGCLASTESRTDRDRNQTEFTTDYTWTRCTRAGCGEYVSIYDTDEHLNMHAAIVFAENGENQSSNSPHQTPSHRPFSASTSTTSTTSSQSGPRKLAKVISRIEDTATPGNNLLRYLSGTSSSYNRSGVRSLGRSTYHRISIEARRAPGRLGKRELGPYAFEDSMPNEVRRQLIEGSALCEVNRIGRDGRLSRQIIFPNETAGIIPVLADMCSLSHDTLAAYFCHPSTRHIHRIQCNGNFCGYWSIQVLLSYLHAVRPDGPQELPNVLKLQSYIHQAWDRGICPHGKIETGGIQNTRKCKSNGILAARQL